MTIQEWIEEVKKYDKEDLTSFIDALETLNHWNAFFSNYHKEMDVLKQILVNQRVSLAMKEEEK